LTYGANNLSSEVGCCVALANHEYRIKNLQTYIDYFILVKLHHFNFFHSFLVFVCVVRFWNNFQVFGKQYLRNQDDVILGIIWETQNQF
jgi:hypothetical protein